MKKILIANRGEIALRVMRSCRKMGIKTVAVFSEADRNALHVRFADEAVLIGAPPSSESYLVMDKILKAAQLTGAEGIHPGYGFLSENSTFAKMIEKAGITFIGPKSHAIEIMGSKLAAKDAVSKYDIPMVPGTDNAISDENEAIQIAKEIGFPILIKASAGGGGKGMRVVNDVDSLPEQMQRATSEALSAFGDGSVFIEKYISSPRHIEIQILADTHGNFVHLFERECSIQRRHQKVVEEAPSVVLTSYLRKEMGAAAIRVAKACDYVGAGTVEFLLDEDNNFYFLEMNTRLQVEHPVTELITNIDLVEEQIKVARGEKLSFAQDDLKINGHALELRVYAEDSFDNFSPNVGTLTTYDIPKGKGVRVDDGYEKGMEIPIYYDPMIAKLITYGASRNEAIERMKQAIADYKIEGIKTTLPFGKFVLEHDKFIGGDFNTHFVKNYYSSDKLKETQKNEAVIAGRVALKKHIENKKTLVGGDLKANSWKKTRI
ncbi:MAG: acetyl-CoA carboxylase biotin carboxylase subunit [Saprospiraceae bacterium]